MLLGIAPWSNPWADFGERYVKTRAVAEEVPLGFRNINISVFTPKVAQNPSFGAL